MSFIWVVCYLSLCATGLAQPTPASLSSIYTSIVGNETSILKGGATASVLSIRESYVPVILDSTSRVAVAAGTFQQGAVFIVGHETLVDFNLSKVPLNAALWMASVTNAPATVNVGIVSTSKNPSNIRTLTSQDPRFNVLKDRVLPANLSNGPTAANVHMIYLDTSTTINTTEAMWLYQYVSLGGALIMAGHTWNWQSSNPLKVAAIDHHSNVLLNQLGLTVLPNYASLANPVLLPASLPDTALYANGYAAVLALRNAATAANTSIRSVAVESVRYMLSEVPTAVLGNTTVAEVDVLAAAASPVVAIPDWPYNLGAITPQPPLQIVTAAYELAKHKWFPAASVPASPAAFAFPGLNYTLTPTTQTVTVTINATYNEVNGRYKLGTSWHSTGVYMTPGQLITITIPSAAVGKLSARIGCHTDGLWSKAKWYRMPEVSKVTTLTSTATDVASSYGGLLYIQVPTGSTLGVINITIGGSFVLAPLYRHTVTTEAEWNATRSQTTQAAPWVEFASSKLVLSVNATSVPTVSDPVALMNWWDSILDAHAKLSQVSNIRPRPERIVLDVDISAGWMHSGHPIMGYFSISNNLVNITSLQANGDWGSFHELGHNHQLSDMEIPNHTGECTVNIWSVHAMTTIVGKTNATNYGHSALTFSERTKRLKAYNSTGKNWDADWSVWLCLETYLQLYESFGWDFYYRVFNEYQTIPAAERPGTTDAKIQQWVLRTSKQAGVDLGPFYKYGWNFPVTDATLNATSSTHPVWTANPMKTLGYCAQCP